MDELISVIIPVYNSEQYLTECVESVLRQTEVETEVLLIDDGSTDGSFAICDSFCKSNSNIRVFHTENYGVSHARNIGLDNAKGEYITFLDADDALISDSLNTLLRLLKEFDADIAVGRKRILERDGNIRDVSYPNAEELWQGSEGLVQSLKDHPAAYAVWGKLYRADFLRDVRFEEGRAVHEDSYYLFCCMLKQPKVIVRDIAVIDYHVSEDSASRAAFSEKFFDILYFADCKDRTIREQLPQYASLTENLLLKAHLALLNNLSKTNDKKYREAERSSLRYVKEHHKALIAATDNDIRFLHMVLRGFYYPRKHIKMILKGV